MEIVIDPHALERAHERGTNEKEIRDVILNGWPIKGKYGRRGKNKVYPFKAIRNDKYYDQKKVEVYYAEEDNRVITVTVYVFYGKWEEQK